MTHFLDRLVARARGTAPRIEPLVVSRFAPVSSSDIPPTDELQETQSHKRVAPPRTATQPSEPEGQPPVAPSPLAIESDSAETRSQQSPAPSKTEPAVTPAETADAPITVFGESLLVPQLQEPVPLLGVRPAHTPPSANPPVVSAVEIDQNNAAADPARPREKRDAKSRAPVPTPPLSPLHKQERDQPPERSTPHEVQPRALVSAPLLPPLHEEARDRIPERTRSQRVHPRALISRPSWSVLRDESREQAPVVRVTIGRIEVRAAPEPAPAPRRPPRPSAPRVTLDNYLKSRRGVAR